ncbi:hypothetical protein D3C76_1570490 [compost metagenome]
MLLNPAGNGRKRKVRRRRSGDDEVDVIQRNLIGIAKPLRGPDTEVRGEFVLGGDVPLLDARSLHDPLVARFYEPLQIPVGQDFFGNIGP